VEKTPNTDENIKPKYFNLPISFHPVKWNNFVGKCICNQSKNKWQALKLILFIVGISLPTCQQICNRSNFMLSSKHNKLIISNSYFHVSAFGHFQA
jgi:hypothetical protein